MSENLQSNDPEQWLSRKDEICHADRVERLRWLENELPKAEYFRFHGGLLSKFLFEEIRYCFVYAQYLAVIVLGAAFLERTLAAMFYGAGRNDLERSSFTDLLQEAKNNRWLSEKEYIAFDHVRRIRNPVTHFRSPMNSENIEYRMLEENEYPYTIIEQDAITIVSAVMHMVGKNAL
jgi:hypothetical protein